MFAFVLTMLNIEHVIYYTKSWYQSSTKIVHSSTTEEEKVVEELYLITIYENMDKENGAYTYNRNSNPLHKDSMDMDSNKVCNSRKDNSMDTF